MVNFCNERKIPVMIAESTPFGGVIDEPSAESGPNRAGMSYHVLQVIISTLLRLCRIFLEPLVSSSTCFYRQIRYQDVVLHQL